MNMFYTGLGISRSLGERGVPVFGLTARRGVYGNYTRYAKPVLSPDSRTEPESLKSFLLEFGERLESPAVIFPTRDDDVVFLNRYREELSRYYRMVIPSGAALEICLSKWRTYTAAVAAGVAAPRCWVIETGADLDSVLEAARYPCVLKPLAAHHWRQERNWELVGARKAIAVHSAEELIAEYRTVSQADPRALVQELVAGSDECLVIAACYMDRETRWVAGFNTQKLVQVPPGFGTGCIVQAADRPELFEPAGRLLRAIGFSGIAEVEFKWDAARRQYQLIEINPRPWDQHRLGNAAGIDLIYLAYCDHAGLPMPALRRPVPGTKWVAEDTLIHTALRMLWRRDPNTAALFRHLRGKKIFAIWSVRDPVPFLAYLLRDLIPGLIAAGVGVIRRAFSPRAAGKRAPREENVAYGSSCER